MFSARQVEYPGTKLDPSLITKVACKSHTGFQVGQASACLVFGCSSIKPDMLKPVLLMPKRDRTFHEKLDLSGLRTYSSSQRRRIIFRNGISEIWHSRAASEPDDKKLERKHR